MPKTVCVDSMVCVWGVKEQASEDQKHKIELAKGLFSALKAENAIIILPSPVLTEILSPIPPSERQQLITEMTKRFRIAPFDTVAAIKAAELWHNRKNWQDVFKSKGQDGMRNRFKYDIEIAAIAITRNVDYLYTEDEELITICGDEVSCGKIPPLPVSPQLGMF